MKIDILASGSKGNCIVLSVGDSSILIDAGIAKTKIEKRLLEVGIRADQVKAIFITHAHGDHIKGLPLANKYKIPVYAGEGEWKEINNVDEDLRRIIKAGQADGIDFKFEVKAFSTHHDSFEPLGYVIEELTGDFEGTRCAVCLDTGHIDDYMLNAISGSDYYIIESNHDPRMVEASNYPNSVKARVLSNIGHLNNKQTAEALSKLIEGRGERIYLTHLSSSNNLFSLAEMTTVNMLSRKGFKKNIHYQLEVVTD
ncbi:putative hydrolase [Bacillus sp. TS-2]|nr:putative hydrolase [Bacillus sp. TS-2]